MYHETTHQAARQAAEQMTDEGLLEAHQQKRQDDALYPPFAPGLVDDPWWAWIKVELNKRGIPIP